jgi:hypothetical protein
MDLTEQQVRYIQEWAEIANMGLSNASARSLGPGHAVGASALCRPSRTVALFGVSFSICGLASQGQNHRLPLRPCAAPIGAGLFLCRPLTRHER